MTNRSCGGNKANIMRRIVSRSQRPWDTHPSRVPTQSSEETTDMLFTVPWRHWCVLHSLGYTTGTDEHCRRPLRRARRRAPKFARPWFHRDSGIGEMGEVVMVTKSTWAIRNFGPVPPTFIDPLRTFSDKIATNLCDMKIESVHEWVNEPNEWRMWDVPVGINKRH